VLVIHQDASYQAMVAREHEEEQTQRSMLALNKLKLMIIGKTADEAEKDITKVTTKYYKHGEHCFCLQVKTNWTTYQDSIASFWLTTLDRSKRKQVSKSQLLCLSYELIVFYS